MKDLNKTWAGGKQVIKNGSLSFIDGAKIGVLGINGAGKSTLLETLRETSGNQSSSKVVDSDVWPQKITLQYTDEAGQTIEFSREKNNGTQNIIIYTINIFGMIIKMNIPKIILVTTTPKK